MGLPFITSPWVVVDLYRDGVIRLSRARAALEMLAVAGRYARDVIAAALVAPCEPTTIRLPEDVLSELDRRARARGKDRATLLRAALDRDKEDEVVAAYRSGHLSLSQAAAQLGTDVWSLFDTLAQRGETVSVSLEDWRDSGSSLSVQP